MNLYSHIRLAGAVMMIAGALSHSFVLNLVGLCVHYIGVTGAVDLLERKFDALTKPEEEEN